MTAGRSGSRSPGSDVAPGVAGAVPRPPASASGLLVGLVDLVRGEPGFVDAGIDVPGWRVEVFWHVSVPPAVRATVVAAAAGEAIAVEFATTPYTRDELLAEARRILETHPAAVSAGPNADRPGVRVGVDSARSTPGSVRISSHLPVEVVARGPIRRLTG